MLGVRRFFFLLFIALHNTTLKWDATDKISLFSLQYYRQIQPCLVQVNFNDLNVFECEIFIRSEFEFVNTVKIKGNTYTYTAK